jgi:protein gp37
MGKGLNQFGVKWNPLTGCTKFSEGCMHCYALDRLIPRMRNEKYRNGGRLTCHYDLLDAPKNRRKPTRYFVNNMGDIFHQDVPVDFLKQLFQTMNDCPQHTFRLLTKRTERMLELAPSFSWTYNISMGVTVENAKYLSRIDDLREIPVVRKFVMCEPLLGPLGKMNLDGIELVLVGGESGVGCRPMEVDWVREIRDQCIEAGVMFNFMQYAAVDPRPLGRVLDGREWKDLPNDSPQVELF